MVRIIVEENGQRRAFRLGEGVLTIGSGEAARLRLSSPDVADVHAEIHHSESGTVLRPKPGVLPPKMAGANVDTEVPLETDVAVELGSARLWLQTDEGPVQTPRSATVQASGGKAAGGGSAVKVARREAAIRASKKQSRRSVVQSSRRTVQRGVPSWMVILLLVGGVGIAIFAGSKMFSTATVASFSVDATLDAAERDIDLSNFESARRQIASIPGDVDVSRAQRDRIAALEKTMVDRQEETAQVKEDNRGTQWMEVYLKRYEKRYLQGSPKPAKVRMFVKRLNEFDERWPDHPEAAWVRRQRGRFEGMVDLSEPPTFEELEWEIWLLTNTSPRNYVEGFALLDEYLERDVAPAAGEARELRAKMVGEREEYHTDRLHQADYEYNKKKDANKAVWWLVHSVIWLGDQEMEDEAAEYLIKIPLLEEHLPGYLDKYPDKYAALMENATVRAFALKHDLPTSVNGN